MLDQPSKPRLHSAARHASDDLLSAALDALRPSDLAHLAAHSRPVAEVSP